MMIAQYTMLCHDCLAAIEPGETIEPDPDGGWVHRYCPQDRHEPRICPACHIQLSVTGACDC